MSDTGSGQPPADGQGSNGSAASGSDGASQSPKRQRVEDGGSESAPAGSDASASASTAAAAPAASTAPASAAASLTPAQREALRVQLQRYVRQLSVGCGRSECDNSHCVSHGAAALSGAALLQRARELFQAREPSCVPASAVTPAAVPAPAASSAAAAVPSAAPVAAASAATPSPAPSASVASSPPHSPATPAPSPASATPASAARLSSRSASPASSPAAAAASSSPSSSSSSSFASPAASRPQPSLTELLASASPSLPLRSIEAPIVDASEWVASVEAAKSAWAAAGSPANDMSAFRPLVTRIYKVFNELSCIALSFRCRKTDEDRAADEKRKEQWQSDKQKREAKQQQQQEAAAAAAAKASEDENAMTDVPSAEPSAAPSAAPASSSATAAAEDDVPPAPTATQERSFELSVSSEFVEADEKTPAVDYGQLDAFYAAVTSVAIPQSDGSELLPLQNSMLNGLRGLLTELTLRPLTAPQIHPSLLRAVVLLYENTPLWLDPSSYDILKLLVKFVSSLPKAGKLLLTAWMSDVERWTPEPAPISPAMQARLYSHERLETLLGALQQYISVRIFDKQDLRDVAPAVVFISLIYNASEGFARDYNKIPTYVPKVARKPVPIDPHSFYNDAVNESVDLRHDYRLYLSQVRAGARGSALSNDFSFFRFSFILDAGSKANLLRYDSEFQMQQQYREGVLSAGMDQRGGYLILEVRRTHLIPDTLRALANKSPAAYKKPLKIHFTGEKGVDAGGLRKEFFQMIIAELFDPNYGMFILDEESRSFLFNPDSLDSPLEFELIGALLGIAIYNSTIGQHTHAHSIDIHLPTVVYKQLLGGKPDLDDLIAARPSLGRGLKQLLEFDGDVESTFARDFTLSYESFGEHKVVELKPGGADIPVTNANRHEFVDLYVEYLLEKSIARQFGAFYKGFHRAVGGEALKLFRPFELELVVCGSSEFDFEALQSTTHYEDGYTEESQVIKWLWEIVHEELTNDEKKKLLEFATGSDRVPIRGLASMHLTISRAGPDSEHLPTAHTCFSHVLVPEYSSKEKLRKMLKLALANSKGFGLI